MSRVGSESRGIMWSVSRVATATSLDGVAKSIAKMAVGLIRSQADKQMNSDLANLKKLLEAKP